MEHLRRLARQEYLAQLPGNRNLLFHYNDQELEAQLDNVVCWSLFSRHGRFSLDFVNKHAQRPWRWYILASRFSIREMVKFPHLPWTRDASSVSGITIEIVRSNPNFPWYWDRLSTLFDLTVIRQNMGLEWRWGMISRKSSWKTMMENPDLPWVKSEIARNEDEDINLILSLVKEPWFSIKKLSFNHNLPLEFVDQNPDLDWSWISLSKNPNIAVPYMIFKYPHKPWEYGCIEDGWKLFEDLIKIEMMREYFSAKVIQKNWRYYRKNPDYYMCKRVQIRDLMSLGIKFGIEELKQMFPQWNERDIEKVFPVYME